MPIKGYGYDNNENNNVEDRTITLEQLIPILSLKTSIIIEIIGNSFKTDIELVRSEIRKVLSKDVLSSKVREIASVNENKIRVRILYKGEEK